jgi:hypothetical protein
MEKLFLSLCTLLLISSAQAAEMERLSDELTELLVDLGTFGRTGYEQYYPQYDTRAGRVTIWATHQSSADECLYSEKLQEYCRSDQLYVVI